MGSRQSSNQEPEYNHLPAVLQEPLRRNNGREPGNPQEQANPYRLTPSQVQQLNTLFHQGVRPDLGLLPYQMPRMQSDRPPEPRAPSQRNQKIKNLAHVHGKSVKLVDKSDGTNIKYALEFTYDCKAEMMDVCVYFCAAEQYDPISNERHWDARPEDQWKTVVYKGAGAEFRSDFLLDIGRNLDRIQYTSGLRYYPLIIECSPILANAMEPNVVKSQTTLCKLHKDPVAGTYDLRVVQQKITAWDPIQKKFRQWKLQHVYGLDEINDEESSECVICMCEQRNVLVFPCRHISMCNTCMDRLKEQSAIPKCPVCRALISRVMLLDDGDREPPRED